MLESRSAVRTVDFSSGQVLFLAVWIALAAAVVIASWRADAFVGWTVAIALTGYVLGGFAFGAYAQNVRGRDYLAPDEQAFQNEAVQIVDGWRTGQPHVPRIAGGWPYVNAVVVRTWGPSLVPMRLLTALAGAATVAATYWLARLVFESVPIARLAAIFVLLSPSLLVWSLTNLKERPLGLVLVVGMALSVLVVRRWTLMRWMLLAGAIYLVGALRHYYAPLLAWLVLAGFAAFSSAPWRQRVMQLAALTVSLGFVVQLNTGTFLGLNTFQETVVRYVPNQTAVGGSQGGDEDYSTIGQTAGHGQEVTDFEGARFSRSLAFVLFGGFDSRQGAGRVLELVFWPEWLANFLLFPLALWALADTVRRRQLMPLLPIAFVAGLVLLLAYTHGDDWSTLRFRAVYWPFYLMIAAAGAVQLYQSGPFRRFSYRHPNLVTQPEV